MPQGPSSFGQLSPFTPRVVGIDYFAVPKPGDPNGGYGYPYEDVPPVRRSINARLLVVGGGGAGGKGVGVGADIRAGGGSGGQVNPVASHKLYLDASYPVVVGDGGLGGTGVPTAAGDSSIDGVSAIGGGIGGGSFPYLPPTQGAYGGGAAGVNQAGPFIGANGLIAFKGGDVPAGAEVGSGGGGAGESGTDGGSSAGLGKGGDGVSSDISGTSLAYGAGGGGGGYILRGAGGSSGVGGQGGQGNIISPPGNGLANRGAGGGGGGVSPSTAGNGSAGVVIVRYAGSAQFSGGVVTTSGGDTIHTFTSSGTLSPL